MIRILLPAAVACTVAPPSTTDQDLSTAPTATTADTGSSTGGEVPLAEALDVARMVAHLDALQAIADQSKGHRSLLSAGYTSSVDYVADRLASEGYEVSREPFPVTLYANDLAVLAQSSPVSTTYVAGTDFVVGQYSGNGAVTAEVVAVDVVLPPGAAPNTSTSACEAKDFAGFPAGAVALVQRGTCAFVTKVQNAVAAKASAVIVFNEGQKGRTGLVSPLAGNGTLAAVPVLGTGFALGEALAGAKGATVALEVQGRVVQGTEENLIAETGGDPNQVVMLGAHLDSVPAGAGINDNGSGVAFLLELAALHADRADPARRVRFAFWGGEESGLLGSGAWLTDPTTQAADQAKLASLAAYLNFDMMASPNGGRFVYDGDASDVADQLAYPPGSAAIEAAFLDWFGSQSQPTGAVSSLTRYDAFWFAANGVPAGGLFSGAEGVKTKAEATLFGGVAGQPYDACYHQACDVRTNVDEGLFEELARAGAHVTEVLSTE